MKKILISLFVLLIAVAAFGARARSYNQKLGFASGEITEVITNTSATSAPNYLAYAYVTTRPGEVVSTATDTATQIRIYRAGVPGNYAVLIFLQFGKFTTEWAAGDIIRFTVRYQPTNETVTWDYTIPNNLTSAISIQNPVVVIPAPTITTKIMGNITGIFSLSNVSLSCTGQSSIVTNTTGAYEFTVNPNSTVTITPSKTGYVFSPVSRTYENVTETITGANFAMLKVNPYVAANPTPANGATVISPLIGALQWEYIHNANYSYPTGFKVSFPDNAAPVFVPYTPGVNVYQFPIPILEYTTTYTWRVVPTNDSKSAVQEESARIAKEGRNDSKADAEGAVNWSFQTRNPLVINYGMETPIDPDGSGPLGTFYFNNGEDEAPFNVFMTVVDIASVPAYPHPIDTNAAFAVNLASGGVNDVFIRVPAGTWFAIAYYNGIWNEGTAYPTTGPGTVAWYDVPFVGKGDVPVIVSGGGDPTLPVELSSFTAMYTAGFFVQLTWIVQSETNHLGYNVLRNGTSTLGSAIKVNGEVISSGSSEGTQITYGFRDDEVEPNSTYYYWLESVDLDGATHFFGPVSVVIGNPDTPHTPPVIPTVTELLNAYPNPFNPITTIPYTIKKAGDVKIEIFNVKGQMIWNYEQKHDKAGYFQTSWNGKDNNAKSVASGIYYYRMTSGKYTASKKIVLVK